MRTTRQPRQRDLSLTPGFSPVHEPPQIRNRFNGFSTALTKPLKRFWRSFRVNTGLKPGVNEISPIPMHRMAAVFLPVVLPLFGLGTFAQSADTNATTVQFRTMDISLESKDKPLAAYQLEFSATAGDVRIVGIEGGEHQAFAQPPYYDPKAMQHDRVIIAAFSTETADKLPKGKTRVATIHLQTKGAVEPEFELKLQTAADVGGNKLALEPSVEERKAK